MNCYSNITNIALYYVRVPARWSTSRLAVRGASPERRARFMSPSARVVAVTVVARAPTSTAPRRETRSQRRAMTTARASRAVSGVRDLVETHDVFLLDQFGVLHDGREAYADAVACVRELKRRGKAVYIISNSSRRRDGTIRKLEKMGFDGDAFAGAMTSGETTARFLECEATRARRDANASAAASAASASSSAELGRGECFDRLRAAIRDAAASGRKPAFAHATWGDRGAIELGETIGEAFEIIQPPFTAATMDSVDFILAHGTEAFGAGDGAPPTPASRDDLKALARAAAERKIPLCVANPDVVTVSGSELIEMPGTLALWYAEAFAETRPGEDARAYVCEMGKPDAVIYGALLDEFGIAKTQSGVGGTRIVAVGDSLAHDIAGGERAGLNTVFVSGTGIHVDDVRRARESEGEDEDDALRRLYDAYGATPTYVVERLRW